MQTVFDKTLVDSLRKHCDAVRYRLWIACPFIGDVSSVSRILGSGWIKQSHVNVRLLSDFTDHVCKNSKTVQVFSKVAQVKSLRGLHAKLYIVDDHVLVTSANLTATAFSARYEIGQWLSDEAAKCAVEVFEHWWNESPHFDIDGWLSDPKSSPSKSDEPGAERLPKRFDLPRPPQEPPLPNGASSQFSDYRQFLNMYRELADSYASLQRLWKGSPLFLEVDCFLNFLFHEATGTPSKPYTRMQPQKLTSSERSKLLKQLANEFAAWSKVQIEQEERLASLKEIQAVVNARSLQRLSRDMVTRVVSNMHTYYSNALARKKFLNPANNSLATIAEAWAAIAEPGDRQIEVVLGAAVKPFGFGRSSVQELIGWVHPQSYPIRNANTNAGMRFLGYNVKAY